MVERQEKPIPATSLKSPPFMAFTTYIFLRSHEYSGPTGRQLILLLWALLLRSTPSADFSQIVFSLLVPLQAYDREEYIDTATNKDGPL